MSKYKIAKIATITISCRVRRCQSLDFTERLLMATHLTIISMWNDNRLLVKIITMLAIELGREANDFGSITLNRETI